PVDRTWFGPSPPLRLLFLTTLGLIAPLGLWLLLLVLFVLARVEVRPAQRRRLAAAEDPHHQDHRQEDEHQQHGNGQLDGGARRRRRVGTEAVQSGGELVERVGDRREPPRRSVVRRLGRKRRQGPAGQADQLLVLL